MARFAGAVLPRSDVTPMSGVVLWSEFLVSVGSPKCMADSELVVAPTKFSSSGSAGLAVSATSDDFAFPLRR